jgi:AhpD family alkylhydroperoxidase
VTPVLSFGSGPIGPELEDKSACAPPSVTAMSDTSYVNVYKAFPAGYEAMSALEQACAGAMDPVLFELVKLRASQVNGCAYCIDMHWKDARAAGETEERLYMLDAWREAGVYSERERAALALAEAMTLIAGEHVPADVEAAARAQFDEAGYAALVFTIVTINAWNRLAITSHSPPGRYRPKAHAATS